MRPGHDIKLPIQRFLDSTTPSRHDRHKKTDLYESFDSTRTQPPRWLAVCIHTRAVIQDRHFNLASYTPMQASLQDRRLTTLYYLEGGIGTRWQMGIRGGHRGFTDSSHFSG
jgi:hypothetical protein